ncbi:MAG TPA: hypothetical protein PKY56_00025 [Candidatus Kapabacteria bacterium]|nr:hypothetical protein [Candidatus Kapabacteria bacterium]
MNKEDCKKYCIEIYQDLYRQVTLNSDYVVNLGKNDISTLDKFVDRLFTIYQEQSIGIEFLINIIESCFSYWFGVETKFGKGVIMFNWIFGKKSLERYESIKHLDSKMNKFRVRSIRKIGKIQINSLDKFKGCEGYSKILSNVVATINLVEEEQKARFLNKKVGFAWCLQNTTLYHHLSRNCIICSYQQDCKKALKLNYSKVHKIRGYE